MSKQRKVYLAKWHQGRLTHAVMPKHATMGSFELDRIFGGGFKVLCGKPAVGKTTLSEVPMLVSHVTCRKCLKVIGPAPVPEDEVWPPESTRPLDNPRILGIPG